MTSTTKTEKRILVEVAEKLKALMWFKWANKQDLQNPFYTGLLDILHELESGKLEAQIQREVLEGLHGAIVRKEQELSEDTSMPDTDFQITSRAFLWVRHRIDSQLKEIEEK